jgi:CBS domain-containing protein
MSAIVNPASSAAAPRSPSPEGRMALPVRALMRPGVIAISDQASLLQAQRAMLRHATHAVLVLGARSGRPLGWVTARGCLGRLGEDPALVPAGSVVTEAPEFIEPSASAAEAELALSRPGVSHLLVAHRPDAPPEGVVTALDLVAAAIETT